MRKLIGSIVALVAFSGAAVWYLLDELLAERRVVAELRMRIVQLESLQQLPQSTGVVPPDDVKEPMSEERDSELPESEQIQGRPIPGSLVRAFRSRYPGIENDLNLTSAELDLLARVDAGHIPPLEVEAQLGAVRYEQYLERKTTSERDDLLTKVRASFASTAYELSSIQSAQLAPLLHAELESRIKEEKYHVPPRNWRESVDYREGRLKAQEETALRIVAGARSFLSHEQIAVLESTLLTPTRKNLADLKLERDKLNSAD